MKLPELSDLRRELLTTTGWPSAHAFELATDVVVGLLNKELSPEAVARELEPLYIHGDAEQRRFIVDVILEHAFEDESVRAYFHGWREQPTLADAYREAEDWAEPLRHQRRRLLDLAGECAREMRSKGNQTLSVESAMMGSEAVTIKWRASSGDPVKSLVLTASSVPLSISVEDAVDYALDKSRWQSSEYVSDEWTVCIPTDLLPP